MKRPPRFLASVGAGCALVLLTQLFNSDRASLQGRPAGPWTVAASEAARSEPADAPTAGSANLLEVRRIWDAAPHNAFTDLIRFRDRWFCVFREGAGHVSPDGAIRVVSSPDGAAWTSTAHLTRAGVDLRDPKIAMASGQRLFLTAAGAFPQPSPIRHQTYAWLSSDGTQWTEPAAIGETNVWLWRVTFDPADPDAPAYGVGYGTADDRFVRLYRSARLPEFEPWVERLFDQGYPNETSLVFDVDRALYCLLRRDGDPGTAQLGVARPPYRDWHWRDLGVRIGGPRLIRLPDGRLLAGVRLYDGSVRTALVFVDPVGARLEECLRLPSGGDTSYPGLVWHDDRLWVSYYSSHEGRTAIYLARVQIPPR